MDYIIKGDTQSVYGLATILSKVCQNNNVQVGKAKATFILLSVIDVAKATGLIVEAPTSEIGSKGNEN